MSLFQSGRKVRCCTRGSRRAAVAAAVGAARTIRRESIWTRPGQLCAALWVTRREDGIPWLSLGPVLLVVIGQSKCQLAAVGDDAGKDWRPEAGGPCTPGGDGRSIRHGPCGTINAKAFPTGPAVCSDARDLQGWVASILARPSTLIDFCLLKVFADNDSRPRFSASTAAYRPSTMRRLRTGIV